MHLTIISDQKWVLPETVGLLSRSINQPTRHHPLTVWQPIPMTAAPPHLCCSEPQSRASLLTCTQTQVPRRRLPHPRDAGLSFDVLLPPGQCSMGLWWSPGMCIFNKHPDDCYNQVSPGNHSLSKSLWASADAINHPDPGSVSSALTGL